MKIFLILSFFPSMQYYSFEYDGDIPETGITSFEKFEQSFINVFKYYTSEWISGIVYRSDGSSKAYQ